MLTFRGKPLGTIEPIQPDAAPLRIVRPYEEAWTEIEAQLKRSKPPFASWKDAEEYSRGRR